MISTCRCPKESSRISRGNN